MEIERLYTTGDVARLFRVTPMTVRRWARQGLLGDTEIRTPGNQRRFRAGHVDKLLYQGDTALDAYQEASNEIHYLTGD